MRDKRNILNSILKFLISNLLNQSKVEYLTIVSKAARFDDLSLF